MKGLTRTLFLLFVSVSLYGQQYGRALGFPADPVLSATYYNGTLYLGTQGSGVYQWDGARIIPAPGFEDYARSTIYGFAGGSSLVPLTQGEGQGYPIEVQDPLGTRYTITEAGLSIRYSDFGTQRFSGASSLWTLHTPGQFSLPDSTLILRAGRRVIVRAPGGKHLNEFTAKGLVFDLAETPRGLLLSTEGGLYRWSAGGWRKIYDGLPVFAFEGDRVRTPLGAMALDQLLSGQATPASALELPQSSEFHEDYFDVDTLGTTFYGFGPQGLSVWKGEVSLFQIDESRGLPPLGPGSYDVAVQDDTLWVATPKGLWTFARAGKPNPLREMSWELFENGLPVANFADLEPAPASLGFRVAAQKASSGKVYGRYRLNRDSWQFFTPGEAVAIARPAAGKYTLDVELSTRMDFGQAVVFVADFRVREWWYKRRSTWVLAVLFISGLIILSQRRARLRVQEKLALQERLADAELASKRLQMNPHFLFNALDAISNFIFQNQPKDAVRYMGKLAKLMRLTLDSSRSSSVVVADEMELLRQYLDLCVLRYGEFEWSVECGANFDPYEHHLPPLLVQPLVENSVQHAVRPNLSEGKPGIIQVYFSLEGNVLRVSVRDNGPGFDPEDARSESHGLHIIRERLALLEKKYGVRHGMELAREQEQAHSSSGMVVSLILPAESDD